MPMSKSLANYWTPAIEAAVVDLVGRPYRADCWNPDEGFECWTFVHYVYRLAGLDLPRDIYHASAEFQKIQKPYQPLDVVYMALKPVLNDHVGVMVSGYELMHASVMTNGVSKTEISRPWCAATIADVYRLKAFV